VQSIGEPTIFVAKILTTEVCPFERAEDGTLEVIVTVATRVERVEQLLSLMQEADLSTLLALDRELHLLLEQKGKKAVEKARNHCPMSGGREDGYRYAHPSAKIGRGS
jgi:hypothetical protein